MAGTGCSDGTLGHSSRQQEVVLTASGSPSLTLLHAYTTALMARPSLSRQLEM